MRELVTEYLINGTWRRRSQANPTAPPPAADPGWKMLINQPDMSSFTPGSITLANFKSYFGVPDFPYMPSPNMKVVTMTTGEKVFEFFSPANTMGTDDGFATFCKLPGNVWTDKIFTEWEYYFAGADALLNDFDWSMGGKLMGFGGVTSSGGVVGSGNSPSGGTPNPRGFSSRMMWYGPSAGYGGVINNPNELAGYPYLPLQTENYATPVWTNYTFPSRRWVKVRNEVHMNTVTTEGVGDPNGIYRIWVDGNLVYQKTDIVWRIYSNVHATDQQISIFRGGATQDWAAATDSRIRFRKYRLGVAA